MGMVEEQHQWGRGSQRWQQGIPHATQSASGLPRARWLVELFRRLRGVLVAGLVLCCAGLVGVAGATTITEFPIPTANSRPFGDITTGPDGALWFDENEANRIGRITTSGTITEFPLPTANSRPFGITAGPDGALWFTEYNGNKIGRITPAGTLTEFAIPTASSFPRGIIVGPDGALWFTEDFGNKIGRITPAGAITEIPLPTANSRPLGITADPGGAIWFTVYQANKIGRITPAGAITEFAVPTAGGFPVGITGGPDGALWFTENGANKIGRITPAGAITEFAVPTANSFPLGITAGPDGALWFTEDFGNKIGRITTGIQEAAFVTRLYEHVLNREPDAASLQAFVQQITQSGSVVPTVLAFFHSSEFLARNTDHAQFIAILYHTFLNRDPDPDGFTAFLTSLQLQQLTRDNLLDIFMDSQEFQAQASFLPTLDPVTAFVTALYVRILGRGPDQAGLQRFVSEAQRACTTLPTVQTLLASPEFQARHTTNTEFVTLLYRVFLGRVPDAGGLTGFVTPLTQGMVTRDQLVAQFAASAEFQAVEQHLFPPGSCTPTVCLSVYGSGLGSVTVNPQGINGGPNCGRAFAPGTRVTLTAQGGPSYFNSFARFLGWGGDCAAIGRRDSPSHGTCTLVMTTDKSVSADFDCPLFLCGYLSPSEDAWPSE